MTMIDTGDSRFPKAVQIADQAGQWLKCRTPEGRKAYGVPSERTPSRYYLVTQTSCTCQDATRRASSICKHALAVQIHCVRAAGKPMPPAPRSTGSSRWPPTASRRCPTGTSRFSGGNEPCPTATATRA